jgi:hypothetical protein
MEEFLLKKCNYWEYKYGEPEPDDRWKADGHGRLI